MAEEIMEDAVAMLRKGGVVAFPTESSYGLAVDPFNEKAVKKLRELKQEPAGKPMILICASKQMCRKIAFLDERAKRIVDSLMPGALTLVAKKKACIPDFLSKETVAFRISSNEIARELSRKFGKAITATSANLHGKEPAFSPKEVEKYFGAKVDLVIDGGKLKKSEPSTIFDLEKMRVLRKGPVRRNAIIKAMQKGSQNQR
ncbi:MAG: L-threonylcarbamoyladenylate synthase [archaeon]|nr:L-threonylcarbamoyladenylate synthase [archaeon]